MVCGGFTCSRNALAALNVLYILVSFIMIGVAAYGRVVAIITDLKVMGGLIACGVFLFIIALVGLIGAVKHHQVLLFFYMIILFLLFLLQFALACACLAVNSEQQQTLAASGWKVAHRSVKETVQNTFQCCGFYTTDYANSSAEGINGHPSCHELDCCKGSTAACCAEQLTGQPPQSNITSACLCVPCWNIISGSMEKAVKAAGGIGLFFSFTEIIGVWLALRFRNLKDPRANPSAFL